MFVLCYCTIPYCISWIHELSHAITAIMNGYKATNIEVSWPHGGSTTLLFESPFLTGDEVNKYSLVIATGSIISSTPESWMFNNPSCRRVVI